MDVLPQAQWRSFRRMIQTFVNVPCFLIDRKLMPDEHIDRTLVPSAISHSYDEVLFGGILFDCPAQTACEIHTAFGICFGVLPLQAPMGFAVIGPYLPENPAQDPPALETLFLQHKIAAQARESYEGYYRRLPLLPQEKMCVLLSELGQMLYAHPPSKTLHAIGLSYEKPSPCPVFEEDALQAKANAIALRYKNEAQLLAAVMRGDDSAASVMGRLPLERIPNKLRNEKNLLTVLNTLLRKAVEAVKVHPFYIDETSTKWVLRIEKAATVAAVNDLSSAIIHDYCALVRNHSMAHYSSNVRSMLNYIHFNLFDTGLSLQSTAQSAGGNASYLSHCFNKEVGVSLPEYIAQKRMEHAKVLLRRGDTSISQAAAMVGYPDVNYFSRTFKRLCQCTPSAWRTNAPDSNTTPSS